MRGDFKRAAIVLGWAMAAAMFLAACTRQGGEPDRKETGTGASTEEIEALVARLHEDTYFIPRMGLSGRPGCGFSKTMIDLRDMGAAARPYLLRALQEGSSRFKRSVVMILGEMGGGESVKPLMALVQPDETDEVLEGVMRALGSLGDPAAGDVIAETLSWEDHPNTRIEATRALGALRHRKAFDAVAQQLDSEDIELKGASFYALKEMSHPQLFGKILDEIQAQEGQHRQLMVQVLGASGEAALPALVTLAGPAQEQETRTSAIVMLSRQVPDSLPQLAALCTSALEEGNSESYERLARVLARSRYEEARPTLNRGAASTDPKISVLSRELLEKWD